MMSIEVSSVNLLLVAPHYAWYHRHLAVPQSEQEVMADGISSSGASLLGLTLKMQRQKCSAHTE